MVSLTIAERFAARLRSSVRRRLRFAPSPTVIGWTSLCLLSVFPAARTSAQDINVQIPTLAAGSQLVFYTLGPPDLSYDDAIQIARKSELSLAPDQSADEKTMPPGSGQHVARFVDSANRLRMVYLQTAGRLEQLPDLAAPTQDAPSPAAGTALARDWINSSGILKQSADWIAGNATTLSRQTGYRDGRRLPVLQILRTVYFHREIAGLPVQGPDSIMMVSVASPGVVGFSRIVRPIAPSSIVVQLKSSQEVADELAKILSGVKSQRSTVSVNSVKLIYYEQGQTYVQPAYEFLVTVTTGDKTIPVMLRIRIAAGKNSPEPIESLARAKVSTSQAAAPVVRPPTPVERHTRPNDFEIGIGLYFDRLDYTDWYQDAVEFWQSLPPFYSTFGISNPNDWVNLTQFKANFPWMWYRAPNAAIDQSSAFVGSVHLAIVEGHGLPLAITTFENSGDPNDLIDLTTTAGFGGLNPYGGATAYIVWRGCCVVTSPDPADTQLPCQSQFTDAFAPWFNVFKGLRGAYGFHSEMTIQDHEGGFFGNYIAEGQPMLSSWFAAVADAAPDACTAEFDCASAVIVGGGENDTIVDLQPINSQSLEIFWMTPAGENSSGQTQTP
jgi:hypothetical protein